MYDERKMMPKLKCPCCRKRVADLPNKKLKNATIIKKFDAGKPVQDDIILECPHCHSFISLQILSINSFLQ